MDAGIELPAAVRPWVLTVGRPRGDEFHLHDASWQPWPQRKLPRPPPRDGRADHPFRASPRLAAYVRAQEAKHRKAATRVLSAKAARARPFTEGTAARIRLHSELEEERHALGFFEPVVGGGTRDKRGRRNGGGGGYQAGYSRAEGVYEASPAYFGATEQLSTHEQQQQLAVLVGHEGGPLDEPRRDAAERMAPRPPTSARASSARSRGRDGREGGGARASSARASSARGSHIGTMVLPPRNGPVGAMMPPAYHDADLLHQLLLEETLQVRPPACSRLLPPSPTSSHIVAPRGGSADAAVADRLPRR